MKVALLIIATGRYKLFFDDLYKSVITAGTHLAPTIKVAEAAKVIENSQRDINIAFVNELAKISPVLMARCSIPTLGIF